VGGGVRLTLADFLFGWVSGGEDLQLVVEVEGARACAFAAPEIVDQVEGGLRLTLADFLLSWVIGGEDLQLVVEFEGARVRIFVAYEIGDHVDGGLRLSLADFLFGWVSGGEGLQLVVEFESARAFVAPEIGGKVNGSDGPPESTDLSVGLHMDDMAQGRQVQKVLPASIDELGGAKWGLPA